MDIARNEEVEKRFEEFFNTSFKELSVFDHELQNKFVVEIRRHLIQQRQQIAEEAAKNAEEKRLIFESLVETNKSPVKS